MCYAGMVGTEDEVDKQHRGKTDRDCNTGTKQDAGNSGQRTHMNVLRLGILLCESRP